MLQTGLQQEYMCQGWSKEKGSTSRVTFLKKTHTLRSQYSFRTLTRDLDIHVL